MATVIGPTPPGTGVMKPALSFTPTTCHNNWLGDSFPRKIKSTDRYTLFSECQQYRRNCDTVNFFFIYPQSPHHQWAEVFLCLDPWCDLYPHQWLLHLLSPYLLWSAQEHLRKETKVMVTNENYFETFSLNALKCFFKSYSCVRGSTELNNRPIIHEI